MKIRFERGVSKMFKPEETIPFIVIIERSGDDEYWYYAKTIDEAKEFYSNILISNPNEFLDDVSYDLSSFLNAFDFINISKLAKTLGVNESLMRHYAAGTKIPSNKQSKRIMDGVKQLAEELKQIGIISNN